MIDLKHFTIGYKGKYLIEDVNTTFVGNKLTALIGRNGSGKSTLLRAMSGLDKNYYGSIFIEHDDLKDLSSWKLSRTIALVNTNRPRIANMKCKDIVALGRTPYTGWSGKLSASDHEIVEKSIKKVGMYEFRDREINSLSDGEFQKIMIARAIAQDTRIILLDEPTSFLDLPTRYELARLLKGLTETQNKTIIFSTHELEIAIKICDYVALLGDKTITNLKAEEIKDSGLLSKHFPILDTIR